MAAMTSQNMECPDSTGPKRSSEPLENQQGPEITKTSDGTAWPVDLGSILVVLPFTAACSTHENLHTYELHQFEERNGAGVLPPGLPRGRLSNLHTRWPLVL